MKDKRARFFFLAALLCVALLPLAGDDFRVLTIGLAVTYLLLAIASALDHHGRHR